MKEECCPECGHILTVSGNYCTFCGYKEKLTTVIPEKNKFIEFGDESIMDAIQLDEDAFMPPPSHRFKRA